MNNTITQVIVCLAGLAVIAACCVYMVNAGRQETPKEQTTGMPVEMLRQWEQAKKEAVEKETEALRKRVEELEARYSQQGTTQKYPPRRGASGAVYPEKSKSRLGDPNAPVE